MPIGSRAGRHARRRVCRAAKGVSRPAVPREDANRIEGRTTRAAKGVSRGEGCVARATRRETRGIERASGNCTCCAQKRRRTARRNPRFLFDVASYEAPYKSFNVRVCQAFLVELRMIRL